MYVLINSLRIYGAAGILDKELIKSFTKGRDYYILPSSIHETIFVPADSISSAGDLDRMVREINREQVDPEERLTDHCYFYDAGADEIRLRP